MRNEYFKKGLIWFIIGLIIWPLMLVAIYYNIKGFTEKEPEPVRPIVHKEVIREVYRPPAVDVPRYCSYCGSPLSNIDQVFCMACGKELLK